MGFWERLERLWNHSPVFAWALIVGGIGFALWATIVPKSPGWSIGLLALSAGIMSVRPKMSPAEKFSWVALLIIFAILEVRSISKNDADNRDIRDAQNRAFSDIAIRLGNTLSSITGGDSFGYLVIPPNGRPAVFQQGRFPLYDVHIRMVDLNASYFTKPIHIDQLNFDVGEISMGNVWVAPVVVPFDDKDTQKRFNITFLARNGSFQEILRMRKIDGNWESAFIVVVDTPHIRSDGVLASDQRIAKEEVTQRFPKEELEADPDWVLLSKLPPR